MKNKYLIKILFSINYKLFFYKKPNNIFAKLKEIFELHAKNFFRGFFAKFSLLLHFGNRNDKALYLFPDYQIFITAYFLEYYLM